MFQVRIHGRGGQGVVTAAETLSIAAFLDGEWAQAFPSFGSERTGAPVVAFCRIDHKEIRSREPVMKPDALIIQDPTLLHQIDVFAGLASNGFVLINSTKSFEDLGLGSLAERYPPAHLCCLPATEISLRHVGRPVPNIPLLAGFAAITGLVKLESIHAAIGEKFKGKTAAANIAAATDAYATARSLAALQPAEI
ncbi:pyruvate/ketoisovalerate ferredoxin oxidoreductase subunit gamma [Niveibacterium umoris]|uniref:Pyruvate ferredoxin oxidoreductase gamma subunit n=1 Tax=Niveibacterium umoris TaxID=1193620 RepID=A0A840BJ35_9RHOO|nr:2-oxoacid:acceptor oxidoreductase family protein [Niveibacterium umoris]MBB4011618.1 pyruvate ferredoxin oxidoreductase gamma subunit [Niveibacterium umoris]